MYNILPTIQQSIVFVVVGENFTKLFLRQSPSWKRLTLATFSQEEMFPSRTLVSRAGHLNNTPLRNSILFWVATGFCPRSKSYLCCIVFLSNNCSSLTVLQTSYRGHYQPSNMEKSFTIFQDIWIWHSHVIVRNPHEVEIKPPPSWGQ